MSVVTVRNLPEEIHRALKLRAAQHGRSTEAEIRQILEKALRPEERVKIGRGLQGRRFQYVERTTSCTRRQEMIIAADLDSFNPMVKPRQLNMAARRFVPKPDGIIIRTSHDQLTAKHEI